MRLDRWWGIPLSVTLGAIFICFAFPLLVQGMDSLLGFIRGGIFVLLALPQVLWWGIGVTILSIWGLLILVNLGINKLSSSNEPSTLLFSHGRFRTIHRSLSQAGLGSHYQDEVRNILRSLAIDLITLKLDISEEEARQRLQQGDWTEDQALKAYFSQERSREEEERGFWRRFKRKKSPAFLEETQETLDRLRSYNNFSDGGKRFDLANPNN